MLTLCLFMTGCNDTIQYEEDGEITVEIFCYKFSFSISVKDPDYSGD